MKVKITDAHDRLLVTKKEENVIQQGVMDCKYRNDLSLALFEYSNYIYIFGHKREIGIDEKQAIWSQDWSSSILDPGYVRKYTNVEDIPSFRIIWQPRLTKPEPQDNSWLFRTEKNNNDFDVFWIIPQRELWGQNKKGNMMEDPIISESIHLFINDKAKLQEPFTDDLPLERVQQIYKLVLNTKNKPFLSI